MKLSPITIEKCKLYCSLFLVIVSFIQVFWSAISANGFFDLPAFTQSSRAVFAGHSPYEQEYHNQLGTVNFQYPPGAILILSPLLFIPAAATPLVATVLFLICFITGLWVTFSLLQTPLPLWRKLLLCALLLQTFPLKMSIMLGQVNTIVLLLMVSSLVLLKRKQIVGSALLLSGAISLKIVPIVFVVIALCRRQLRWPLLVLVSTLILNGIFFSYTMQYISSIFPHLLTGLPSADDYFNQSIPALLFRLHQNWQVSGLTLAIALSLIVALVYKTKRLPVWCQMIAALPILVLLAANSWQHHLILMYPFLILYVQKWRWFLPVWLLLAVRPTYVVMISPNPSWLWSYQTIGLLMIVLVFLWSELRYEKQENRVGPRWRPTLS